MNHTILEIEFFSEVNDSMILELYRLGMSNSLLDPDDKPLTRSKNRFARVIEKSDRSLCKDIVDGAMEFFNKFNQDKKLSAILWERAFPGLSEKDLTPRKIESFGVNVSS